uniref:Uncharacterized protein n=1 Tax=Desertifilum tharense IPPAS B-1220 TaxID=1781255 RepID=A0ACD5GRE5_9CYAN
MGKKGVGSWELGVGEEEVGKLANYQLSTHEPTQHSALYTQHLEDIRRIGGL